MRSRDQPDETETAIVQTKRHTGRAVWKTGMKLQSYHISLVLFEIFTITNRDQICEQVSVGAMRREFIGTTTTLAIVSWPRSVSPAVIRKTKRRRWRQFWVVSECPNREGGGEGGWQYQCSGGGGGEASLFCTNYVERSNDGKRETRRGGRESRSSKR